MKAYDKLYIDGAWVEPSGKDTLDVINSDDRRGHRPRSRPATRTTSTAAVDGRQGGVRRLVADVGGGAGQVPARASTRAWAPAWTRSPRSSPTRSACRRCCRSSSRSACRMAASPSTAAARRGVPVRGAGRQLARRARARRRRRLHHAVELPAAPDRRQGRACAGRRLHGRAEAERGGAARRLHARRDHRRGRPARRACSTS